MLAIFSAGLPPTVSIEHFDSGSSIPYLLSKALPVSPLKSNINTNTDPPIPPSTVGDSVPLPPVVQLFINAYEAGKVTEALGVIFDPMLKLVNEMSVATPKEQEDKEKLVDMLSVMRGMMRMQMSGPKGDARPPKQIVVMKSFRLAADQVRIHLSIRHDDYTYYIRLVTQDTPNGVMITNVGFGDADILSK